MSFVGIGMGAIQSGLFLPRAQEAGLARTVLVRRAEQAQAINGRVTVNVAHADGIRAMHVDDVAAHHLMADAALPALVGATHIAVAVSSVTDYAGLAPLLAQAMQAKAVGRGPPAVLYASENALDAADQLSAAIRAEGGPPDMFEAVDTVIGKMSRTVRDPTEIAEMALVPGVPGLPEAWLVEAYDDIHVSACRAPVLPRLLPHCDLLPYEQAKLNGHNAAHVTLAYAGQVLGLPFISDVLAQAPIAALVREAFVEETGAALIALYGRQAPLFTPGGWRAHGADLFARMGNPWLRDDCLRVGRDAPRKLGWDDRLVGTIRMVEGAGISAERWHMALHLAMEATDLTLPALAMLWRKAGVPQASISDLLHRTAAYRPAFLRWRGAFPAAA